MKNAPIPRQDHIDTAVTALDNVFQEHAKLFPNYAQPNRHIFAQEKIDAVFDRTTTHTQTPEREIAQRIALLMIDFSVNIEMAQKNEEAKNKQSKHPSYGAHTRDKLTQSVLSDELGEINVHIITNTLLANLGLDQYIPEKGTKRVPALMRRVQAIPEIEEMFECLEPVMDPFDKQGNLNYFRFMRIGKGKNEGYVIGTQRVIGEGKEKERKILFKTDLDNAQLRIEHIEQGYGQEIEKLGKIQAALEDVHARLEYWQDIKNTDELEQLKKKLFGLVDTLKFVKDKNKVTLKERIEISMDVKDRLGKSNPGAIRAHLLRSITFIGRRIHTIRKTSENLKGDKVRIQEKITAIKKPIESFLQQVESYRDEKRPERTKGEKIRDLKILLAQTEKMTFEPYRSFAQHYRKNLTALIAQLVGTTRSPAQQIPTPDPSRLFLDIFIMAKIQRAYEKLHQIYRTITLNGENFDPITMYEDLEKIGNELYESRILKNREVNDYEDQVGKIYHIINSLKKCCKEKSGQLDPAENMHEDEVDMTLPERMKLRMDTYIPNWADLVRSK